MLCQSNLLSGFSVPTDICEPQFSRVYGPDVTSWTIKMIWLNAIVAAIVSVVCDMSVS